MVLEMQPKIVARFRETMDGAIAATRIRTHGDFHLGQVLNTGRDFVIIDFEGEPGRSIEERRIKRSPLRDVAAMVRSFQYAAHAVLRGRLAERLGQEATRANADAWAQTWYRIVGARFVTSYLELARSEPFLARASEDELVALLRMFALEKAIYELHYELLNRPDWVAIPLAGIVELLEEPE